MDLTFKPSLLPGHFFAKCTGNSLPVPASPPLLRSQQFDTERNTFSVVFGGFNIKYHLFNFASSCFIIVMHNVF